MHVVCSAYRHVPDAPTRGVRSGRPGAAARSNTRRRACRAWGSARGLESV